MNFFDTALLLKDMYKDTYFPNFLVEKIEKKLIELIVLLEEGEKSLDEIQIKCDEVTDYINGLESEFYENNSEVETVARESIADSFYMILNFFNINIDIETAIRNRDW
jgi:hypothetical protein